ncbi:hypothetical protein BGZ98_005228 [Dissophora globulifera]|nr:hypothetical protein BGZ98_005228 [Dissophora globulifera]
MKAKTPVMVLPQRPQPSSTQQTSPKAYSLNTSASLGRQLHIATTRSTTSSQQQLQPQHLPQQQQYVQRSPQQRKSTGNCDHKHQYYQQQQYNYNRNYDRSYHEPEHPHSSGYDHDERRYFHNNYTRQNQYGRHQQQQQHQRLASPAPVMPSIRSALQSRNSTPALMSSEAASSLAEGDLASQPLTTSAVANVVSDAPTPLTVLSSAVALAAVAGDSPDTNGEDSSLLLADVEHTTHKSNQDLEFISNSSESLTVEQALAPPATRVEGLLESTDMSSTSSIREINSSNSDCDTLETEEDDDKTVFHGSNGVHSDSNDTDYSAGTLSVDDSLVLDRRSRRKRSMQRLIERNKTLKASLQQAKADLAQERQNRYIVDQIYLKIKNELKAELEQMKELKEQAELAASSFSSSSPKDSGVASGNSYKIAYDNSNYSLSSGLAGGLMLHSSHLLHRAQDEEDEFYCPIASSINSWTEAVKGSTLPPAPPAPSTSPPPSTLGSQSDDQEPSPAIVVEQEQRRQEEEEEDLETKDVMDKKVTFLAEPLDIPALPLSPPPTSAEEECEEGSEDDFNEDDDDDNEDAPHTMMELLMKKEQSRSSEDEVQDQPADANETFESMAHKFLHQALYCKFTPARTILQLDDLLLKYDAPLEDLLLVLAQESMTWWEDERIKAGGPATGGWGHEMVLFPETGERLKTKDVVQRRFKAIYVPLLLNYVASPQDQLMLLEKLEAVAKTNSQLMRNHASQLVALYVFDVLDAEAILEWWKLLEEPEGVFGHGGGLRSMSAKFAAWLEDDQDDSDDDSEDDSDELDSNSDSDDDDDEVDETIIPGDLLPSLTSIRVHNLGIGGSGGGITTTELLSPRDVFQSLDEDFAKVEAENQRMMVIGSDDENDDGHDDDDDDDAVSTTSSLERIEECERKRRISFCTNNVHIHQDGRGLGDGAAAQKQLGRKLGQCLPTDEEDDDDEQEVEEEEDEDKDEDEDDDDDD